MMKILLFFFLLIGVTFLFYPQSGIRPDEHSAKKNKASAPQAKAKPLLRKGSPFNEPKKNDKEDDSPVKSVTLREDFIASISKLNKKVYECNRIIMEGAYLKKAAKSCFNIQEGALQMKSFDSPTMAQAYHEKKADIRWINLHQNMNKQLKHLGREDATELIPIFEKGISHSSSLLELSILSGGLIALYKKTNHPASLEFERFISETDNGAEQISYDAPNGLEDQKASSEDRERVAKEEFKFVKKLRTRANRIFLEN